MSTNHIDIASTSTQNNTNIQSDLTWDNFWPNKLLAIQAIQPDKDTNFTKKFDVPMARVMNIMKLDDSVNHVAVESKALLTKAVEFFIEDLTRHTWRESEANRKRTLFRKDLEKTTKEIILFHFLFDITNTDEKNPRLLPLLSQFDTQYQQLLNHQQQNTTPFLEQFVQVEVGEDGTDPEPLRHQDLFLPIANVANIMKKAIPKNGKISKEVKECLQECVSEFISFITSEASDRCNRERRKTIIGEDIVLAMTTLGFDDYIDPLKLYLQKYREVAINAKGEKALNVSQRDTGLEELAEDLISTQTEGTNVLTIDQNGEAKIIYVTTYPNQNTTIGDALI